MAFCTEACCNAEARKAKEATDREAFAARKAEFERLYPDPKATATAVENKPDVPLAEAKYGVLTLDELTALAEWADTHPKAAG
jgi:hypothetical protein